MKTDTTVVSFPYADGLDDQLTSVLREGARRLLAQAVEAEAAAFLAAMSEERLADGRARLVRHGHGPERKIQTGIGAVLGKRAKLRDRASEAFGEEHITFTSTIRPKWARRTKSTQSWRELLVDLKACGLSIAPRVAVGDGALGFWKAIEEVFPSSRHQRCWQHKALNVLNKMPKSVQPNMKADLREVRDAPDRATAEAAIAVFIDKYQAKYPKAVDCLTKDHEALLTFFDFPAEHWDHLRTSNPIESVFATVRHRTVRTKEILSHKTARLMAFKLVMAAAKTWRRLKSENQLPMVIAVVKFTDAIAVTSKPDHRTA
jgi:transposase-like protein